MPWITAEDCTGCGICVEKCPVGTIFLENDVAVIEMEDCIRCGLCHDVCPLELVRHDSEKIPDEVKANVERTEEFMESCARYLGDVQEKQKCLNRMIKHFNKEKIVAEKTLETLQMLKKKTPVTFN